MVFSLIGDIADAKDIYDDISGFVKEEGKAKRNDKRRFPAWVSMLAAVVAAASLLFIVVDTLGSWDGEVPSVDVREADEFAATKPAPEADPAPDCARDPFQDACK